MNIEFLEDKISRVESVFNNILYMKPEDRVVSPTINALSDLSDALNEIFDTNKCTDILYTSNTDKPFFGIKVAPLMNGSDALTILLGEDRIRLEKYQIEFDSKLFNIGLDSSELTAILLYEVSITMDNYDIIDNIRIMIDKAMLTDDDVLSIRDSANYSQLMIFAVKDAIYKLSDILTKEPEELVTPIIQATNLEDSIISAKEKIATSATGISDTLSAQTPPILKWALMVYRDINRQKYMIYDTLTDAKNFTASRLEKRDIDACINALDRISTQISLSEDTNLNKFLDKNNLTSINELSLFKALKKNGLRSLENELYEYSMRVKNCTDASDAYLIMRGLNSRLGILEDYLMNEDLSYNDRKHWEGVAESYRQLRVILSKKKFEDKQYGLFFDYSALDKLDKKSEDD